MQEKNNLNIQYQKTENLRENPSNARTHSEKQIHKIARSLKKFGFNNPILVDLNNKIVAGHSRFRAAKQLGIKEVPVIFLEHLSPDQIRGYMITDNKLALEAGWDKEILKIEFQYFLDSDFDISLTGFETPEIDIIINNETNTENDDEKPDLTDALPEEKDIQPKVNAGDLYKLGNSYLYCGNALEENSYKHLLGDQKAGMVFADPPYNVKIDGHVCGSGKIKHKEFAMAVGEMNQEEFTDFLKNAFKNLSEYSTDGSIHFICMDWRHIYEIISAGNKVYSELKNICVWNKVNAGMGSLYRSQHELVFVFKNGTNSHINNIELGKNGRYRTNVWNYRGVHATNPKSMEDLKLHPTVKPVAMIMDAILDCSNPNDIILDCFTGSGSTIIAAEKTRRKAYAIEYEPHYCDVAIYRYEKLFGKKAEFIKNYKEDTYVA